MTKSRDTADILEDVKVDGNVTAVGQETLKDNTGAHNTGVGYRAMFNPSMSGSSNVAFGNYNLYANTSGASNTALGYQSLFSNSTASNNNAVGYQSLYSNTTGAVQTAMGHAALYSNTTGTENTAFGGAALLDNTTGNYNVAVGRDALVNNTTASNNTAVGYHSLYANTTGTANTAVGINALDANQTSNSNTAVGKAAGSSTTGAAGTYIGAQAGQNTNSVSNTFIGCSSGEVITTGQKNTILGRFNGNENGLDIRTSSNNIVLSDGDGNPRIITHSNGNTSFGTTVNHAVVGVGTTVGNWGVVVRDNANNTALVRFETTSGGVGSITHNGSATAYNTSSDHRLKENVDYTWDATTRLKQLKPARFNFIADPDTTVDGFLAHEAQAVVPEAVTGTHNEVDDDGVAVMQGIDQSKLVPLLVKTIQELEARITALEGA